MLLLSLAMFCIPARTEAAPSSFSDNFNRANTASPDGGLGSDWSVTGSIFLNSNVAKTQTNAVSYALYDGVSLSDTFTVSVDLYSQSAGRYGGVIFNYADASNYYVFRASFDGTNSTVWQFLKVVGGTQTVVSAGTITAGDMPLTTWRTLTVSSTPTAGTYTYALTNQGGDSTIASGSVVDTSLAVSGEAGFYFSGSFIWADNFALQTTSPIPEPSAVAFLVGMAALGVSVWAKRRAGKE